VSLGRGWAYGGRGTTWPRGMLRTG
jgi:hypothetical protein